MKAGLIHCQCIYFLLYEQNKEHTECSVNFKVNIFKGAQKNVM